MEILISEIFELDPYGRSWRDVKIYMYFTGLLFVVYLTTPNSFHTGLVRVTHYTVSLQETRYMGFTLTKQNTKYRCGTRLI